MKICVLLFSFVAQSFTAVQQFPFMSHVVSGCCVISDRTAWPCESGLILHSGGYHSPEEVY